MARTDRGFGTALPHLRQPRQRERRQRHHDVTHGDVEEPRQRQVARDAEQPRAGDIRAEPRPAAENRHAHRHFDHADDRHERVGGERQQLCRQRAHVRAPVGQQVEELVQSGEGGGQADAGAEHRPRGLQSLIHCLASCRLEAGGRKT
jgi:hypothetical protein